MAATELRGVTGLWQRVAAFAGSLLAMGGAKAIELPENRAEGLYHLYKGGGVTADGPALLVRKSIADKVSLSAQYYVDAVSNASIDVVTTASPFKETRTAWTLGATTVVRDTTLAISLDHSREPDYTADTLSADATHEVFGGMTSVDARVKAALFPGDTVHVEGEAVRACALPLTCTPTRCSTRMRASCSAPCRPRRSTRRPSCWAGR